MIETYRRENGVRDRADAFGPEPEGGAAEVRQRRVIQEVERAQRQLQDLTVRERSAEPALEIGL